MGTLISPVIDVNCTALNTFICNISIADTGFEQTSSYPTIGIVTKSSASYVTFSYSFIDIFAFQILWYSVPTERLAISQEVLQRKATTLSL